MPARLGRATPWTQVRSGTTLRVVPKLPKTPPTEPLFEGPDETHKLEPFPKGKKKGQAPSERLWTSRKAALIQRYPVLFRAGHQERNVH